MREGASTHQRQVLAQDQLKWLRRLDLRPRRKLSLRSCFVAGSRLPRPAPGLLQSFPLGGHRVLAAATSARSRAEAVAAATEHGLVRRCPAVAGDLGRRGRKVPEFVAFGLITRYLDVSLEFAA